MAVARPAVFAVAAKGAVEIFADGRRRARSLQTLVYVDAKLRLIVRALVALEAIALKSA